MNGGHPSLLYSLFTRDPPPVFTTVDFRALEIEIPGKSTCRFLNDLVEFRNRAAKVPIDFYRPISKTWKLTVVRTSKATPRPRHAPGPPPVVLAAPDGPSGIARDRFSATYTIKTNTSSFSIITRDTVQTASKRCTMHVHHCLRRASRGTN